MMASDSPTSGSVPRYLQNQNQAKKIKVYQNGNGFFVGRQVVVNPRYVKNFDNFLDAMTDFLKPEFGAVRDVFTPRGTNRITTLENIKNGEEYVVNGGFIRDFRHLK